MDSRLVELEIKITHQESTLAALDEVVTEQRKLLDELRDRLTRVEAELRGEARQTTEPGEEPPPPHY